MASYSHSNEDTMDYRLKKTTFAVLFKYDQQKAY